MYEPAREIIDSVHSRILPAVTFDPTEAVCGAQARAARSVLAMVVSNDLLLTRLADAFTLLEHLATEGVAVPKLVAICPPGRVSDRLSARLFELGFTGIIQKPIQYSRLVEVIEATLAPVLRSSS